MFLEASDFFFFIFDYSDIYLGNKVREKSQNSDSLQNSDVFGIWNPDVFLRFQTFFVLEFGC